MATHRVLEVLVGSALLVFCCYQAYTGQAFGSWRIYHRDESPGWYWTSILLQFAVTAAFLLGFTHWRD